METITKSMTLWLQECGIPDNYISLILQIGAIIAIILLSVIINKVSKKAIIPIIHKVTSKTDTSWDDYLLSKDVLKHVFRLIPPILVYSLLPVVLPMSSILVLALRICIVYIIIVCMQLSCAFISSLYAMSNEHKKFKDHSLKGFYQMIKLVVICIGVIIIISTIIDKNPIAVLTGLGAGTAILMLVFQDTIKGFVAGIQLTANDMLRPGDWITMPKYGADGDVIEVTLTTVKVRNWDNTITTVPPYALLNDSFQNWRGMFDTGGRRVKRSINIDMNTVRFCTKEELEQFKQQPWMEGFEYSSKEEVNLHIFRHYIEHYLHNHPKVSKELTILVRQLQPTSYGMPIELYFFSADTAWLNYEALQAEVFDHMLSILHTFGLRVFQSPSGTDLKNSTI